MVVCIIVCLNVVTMFPFVLDGFRSLRNESVSSVFGTTYLFFYIIALVRTTKSGEEIIIVPIATDQSSNINQTLSKKE